eukprot:NODE_132_length_2261_cov_195.103526_g107_i0.p1 GENE.NODE_132_length_2261_cov_195.103526_g107_i0~~NODE_132_length_2261_cov_195.103526_g107_i0.p1  ORF type:complete len:455 (-),score=59.95 NODE_132_length_2261_cov_195.103526_g107_i0:822-2186(-)
MSMQMQSNKVGILLKSLGLDSYANVFTERGITLEFLMTLEKENFRRLIAPSGPRKILMDAIDQLKRQSNEASVTLRDSSRQNISIPLPEAPPPGTSGTSGTEQPQPAVHQFVVKVLGLPFSVNEADVRLFFSGLPVQNVVVVEERGRPTGIAFVSFGSEDDVVKAMYRDGEYLGQRYVRLKRHFVAGTPKTCPSPPECGTRANTVYVGNVSAHATEEDVRGVFQHLAECIAGLTWAIDRKNGHFKGYAFIVFVDENAAQEALQFDGAPLHGNPLLIKPRDRDPPETCPGRTVGGTSPQSTPLRSPAPSPSSAAHIQISPPPRLVAPTLTTNTSGKRSIWMSSWHAARIRCRQASPQWSSEWDRHFLENWAQYGDRAIIPPARDRQGQTIPAQNPQHSPSATSSTTSDTRSPYFHLLPRLHFPPQSVAAIGSFVVAPQIVPTDSRTVRFPRPEDG